MNVPPAAIEAFTTRVVNLWPEVRTTIERRDQKRAPGGGGGRTATNPAPANLTAVDAAHDLHLLLLQILSEVDWQDDVPHRYRNPVDAAKDVLYATHMVASFDNITEWLREGERLLRILEREIDLPPEEVQLGECECGEPMVARGDEEEVTCKRCELIWEVDERIAHRQNKLDDVLANYVGTAKEIADIARAKGFNFRRKTISEWYRRDRLHASGEKMVNGRPAPTFRFEDVRKKYLNELDSISV